MDWVALQSAAKTSDINGNDQADHYTLPLAFLAKLDLIPARKVYQIFRYCLIVHGERLSPLDTIIVRLLLFFTLWKTRP